MSRVSMEFAELLAEYRKHARSDRVKARRVASRYRALARRRGDDLRSAEGSLLLAEVDAGAGRLRPAVSGFEEAIRGFEGAADPQRATAARIGLVQALALLGESRAVRREIDLLRAAAAEPLTRAYVEIAIGTALAQLGEEVAAAESYVAALKALGRRKHPETIASARATARLNLGIRRARLGSLAAARIDLSAAFEHFDGAGMAALAAIARHNRGWALGLVGRLVEAYSDLRTAREDLVALGDRRRAALVELDEAELALRLGHAVEAKRGAQAAARRLAGLHAVPDASRAQLLQARALGALGRARPAEALAEKARQGFESSGDVAGAALAKVWTGADPAKAERILRERGHLLAALELLLQRARSLSPRRGAALLRRDAKRYPELFRRWLRPEILRLSAEAAEPGEAIRLLRRAVAATEDLRLRAPTGSLRASVLASRLSSYHELARALLARGGARDRREAFLVLDSARARTLREEMDREAPGLMEEPALRRERTALEELWRTLEARDRDPGGLRAAPPSMLRAVERAERELLRRVEAADRLGPGGRIRPRLPGHPCLAFELLDDDVIGMLSVEGEVAAWNCGAASSVSEALRAFQFQVARRLHGGADVASAESVLNHLSTRLFAGAPELPDGGPLCVVLAPALGGLPIGALELDGEPLIERFDPYHAPTAQPAVRPTRRRGESLLVGVDDGDLPAVRRELNYLRTRLRGARVVRGESATRDTVLAALGGAGLVHLAGHARARPDLPPLSALPLSRGWLTAADLADADLEGALVVLSACRTGDPSLRWRGEALAGFPRALLASGVRALVASRWEVRDETAYAWMKTLYPLFGDRIDPERALAQAARRLRRRKETSHPADWAAFLLIRGGSAEDG